MTVRAETEITLTRVDDGYSPTATVTKTGDTATITITDKNQTTTASISDGEEGVSITSVKPQYYLSTSSSSATGGSWSDTPQAFVGGMYYWTRDYIDYSDGTHDTSTAVYNTGLTQANQEALEANTKADNVAQYFWFNSTDTAGEGAGAHITEIPSEDFIDDPSNGGYNVLTDSTGMHIRNGLSTLASYGTSMVIGEDNKTRVEIDSDTVRSITEDGVEAFSIESSSQDEPQEITKTLTNKVAKNSTQTVTLSDLSTGVADTTIRLSYVYKYYYQGMAEGPYMSAAAAWNFTKGTASTHTDTYTENATGTSVTRTYSIAYDGVNSFTITNPSPYFTFDLTKIKFTSQAAPSPETNFTGLFYLNREHVVVPSRLVVQKHTLTTALYISNGSYDNSTYTVTKSGYYPLGIVGWRIQSGSGGTFCLPFTTQFESGSSGSATLRFGFRASGGTVDDVTLIASVLWVKE